MLRLERVSKIYHVGAFGGRELQAVEEVSFEVGDRQVVALIGESGSGKSTIGRMILRLIPITSGRIVFGEEDVSTLKGESLRNYYRRVQGVFQDPFSTFNPIFKADRIFQIARRVFFPEMDEREWGDRVENALHAVGLNPREVLGKFPHQLSGGQLQRFLIARALVLDTEFLVADEIISMLDASTRIDVLNLLGELCDEGLSVLFITHDLSLGYYISDRAVILYRGNVVEMGDTEKVFNRALHPYTQMLMEAVPRLDRKWKHGGERLREKYTELLEGCVYYGRCPIAEDRCKRARPKLRELEPDHWVACWLK